MDHECHFHVNCWARLLDTHRYTDVEYESKKRFRFCNTEWKGHSGPCCSVPFRHDTALPQTTGWTFRGSAYCQLIRKANKAKCLEFARRHLHEAEAGFNDVIFSDEATARATVQLESPEALRKKRNGKYERIGRCNTIAQQTERSKTETFFDAYCMLH